MNMNRVGLITIVLGLAAITSEVGAGRILTGTYTYSVAPDLRKDAGQAGPFLNDGTTGLSDGNRNDGAGWDRLGGFETVTFDLEGAYHVDKISTYFCGPVLDWGLNAVFFQVSPDGGKTWIQSDEKPFGRITGFGSKDYAWSPPPDLEITHVKVRISLDREGYRYTPLDEVEIEGTPVPEPLHVLMVTGLVGVVGMLRRKNGHARGL
jgi:hypothetical protein